MNKLGYFVFGYMIFGLFLAFRSMYIRVRLARYIFNNYPEERNGYWLYTWRWTPLFKPAKKLREFIKNKGPIDSRLLIWAKKMDLVYLYFLFWISPILLAFLAIFIHHFITGK
jgi:hypothetical protein